MRIGSLFSGYGGLDRAAERVFGARTAWVSDIDKGACKVLAHRYPDVPNLGDITTISWADVEPVDIITGGSPCKDLSTAGRRAGMTEGTRSNLWVAMREAIAHVQPRYVVWENVRGAFSARAASDLEHCAGCMGDERDQPSLRALNRVLGDLSDLGYDTQWRGLRAADVGACHGRFRVFLLAWRRRAAFAADPAGRFDLGSLAWADQRAVARRDGESSGHLTLLPTPRTSDTNGAGTHGTGGMDLRTAATLLPTPRATDGTKGGPNQRGSKGDLMLPRAVHRLLPTPTAVTRDRSPEEIERRWLGGERGSRGRNLDDMTAHVAWGDYAAAVARHEQALGRPAPAPTEPGRNGKPRLSARFTEWMMMLPDGWITDTPDATRNEALKLCGNGVVTAQAEAALRDMLAAMQQEVAS